jgi:hypothetical protein
MDIKVLFGDLYCESCRILEGDKVNEIKIWSWARMAL